MVSFDQMWKYMETEDATSPLMGSGEEGRAISVVRAGKDFRKEEETPFWDDFISLCANAQGLAELLDVNQDKVSNWPARIQEHLNKLEDHDEEGPTNDEEMEMIPSGDNGAFTVPNTNTNSDPNLGAL